MTDHHANDTAPDASEIGGAEIAGPTVDPTQPIHGNRTGERGNNYGQEADTWQLDQPRHVAVGSDDGGMPADPVPRNAGAGIPPEDGRCAYVDQKTGEVHGSGSGAGGGQGGEDYDSDAASGSRTEG